jgi:hypothetical protein
MSLKAISIFKTPILLAQSAVPVTITGTIAETNFASVTLPGKTLSANGILRISALVMYNGAQVNTKTTMIRFGGQKIFNNAPAANVTGIEIEKYIRNANATNSQVFFNSGAFGPTSTTGSMGSSAIDTTVDQTIVFAVQLADATDSAVLLGYTIEVINP